MPVRIDIEARPASLVEALRWDSWRSVWIIRVREKAEQGRANEAILAALGRWLAVERSHLRWVRSGKGTRKIAEVEGMTDVEVRRRLGAASSEP